MRFHVVLAGLFVTVSMFTLAGCQPAASQGVIVRGSSSSSESEKPASAEEGDDEGGSDTVSSSKPDEDVELKDVSMATFTNPTKIDNKWFPLTPGTRWTWQGTSVDDEGDEEAHWIVFTVTDLTREVAGVQTVVCWDRDYVADVGSSFEDAELVEAELVFFAQDDDGAIWHFGQYPEEYDEGKLAGTPAWLHGIKDCKAGIHMPSNPQVGDPKFAQGWAPSVPWTDRAFVYQDGQEVEVPAGKYSDVLVFDESCQEEPDAHALKYYAAGVGTVKVGWRGTPSDREVLELTKVEQLDDQAKAETRASAQELSDRATALFAKMKSADQVASAATVSTVSASPSASQGKELGTEEFGLTSRELVQKIEQVESSIAKLMREEGFEYVPCDYQTVRKGMTADKSLPGLTEKEFVQKYGFGVSTMYTGQPPQLSEGYSPARVGLGQKNIEIFKNLSPADRVAYNRALFGENWDASFAVGLETENFSRCGGCTRKAIEQVFEADQLRPNYYNPKDALINQDPRMKAALRKFAEEMRSEGFSYNHPDDVETDLREQLAAITGGEMVPVAELPAEKQEALKKLQELERRVAVKSLELQEDLFDPVEEQIEKELFARDVK